MFYSYSYRETDSQFEKKEKLTLPFPGEASNGSRVAQAPRRSSRRSSAPRRARRPGRSSRPRRSPAPSRATGRSSCRPNFLKPTTLFPFFFLPFFLFLLFFFFLLFSQTNNSIEDKKEKIKKIIICEIAEILTICFENSGHEKRCRV